jgi:hypothetical protein
MAMRMVSTVWPRDCTDDRPNTVTGALGVTDTIPYRMRSASESTRRKCGTAPSDFVWAWVEEAVSFVPLGQMDASGLLSPQGG